MSWLVFFCRPPRSLSLCLRNVWTSWWRTCASRLSLSPSSWRRSDALNPLEWGQRPSFRVKPEAGWTVKPGGGGSLHASEAISVLIWEPRRAPRVSPFHLAVMHKWKLESCLFIVLCKQDLDRRRFRNEKRSLSESPHSPPRIYKNKRLLFVS